VIRVLVVDDERPARTKLQRLLRSAADVELVAEAEDGETAVDKVRDLRPDLLFLDVQMPGLDGFGVMAELEAEERPLVVFVTAFDEYAVRAFEVHAVDYLLKPVAPDRFATTLDRVRQRLAGEPNGAWGEPLERLLASLDRTPRFLRRIMVPDGERSRLLKLADVSRIEADRNNVVFHSRAGRHVLRGSLGTLEQQLDPARWVRINRSEIVQIDRITHLEPWFHGEYRVILDDGVRSTWSRRFLGRAEEVLGKLR
jgi:two-component system LytT family response regulator